MPKVNQIDLIVEKIPQTRRMGYYQRKGLFYSRLKMDRLFDIISIFFLLYMIDVITK